MTDRENAPRGAHNVIMENRRNMSISGVRDVDSFDEQTVVLQTELGLLTINGEELHISHLDQTSGELTMSGHICELIYAEPRPEHKSFWSRLAR